MSARRGASLRLALLCVGIGLLAVAGAAAETAPLPELRFDPFAAPELGAAGGQTSGENGGTFVPVLRGTLVAGENSLANLGGIVLRIGQEAEGWRLLAVSPFQATFDRGGQVVVLDVDGETAR